MKMRLLAAAGLIGPAVFFAATTTVALRRHGFNGLSQGLSTLAIGPDGWIQAAAFITLGITLAMLARGLALNIPQPPVKSGTRLLYAASICLVMLSLVQTETDHSIWSINRIVHDGFSIGVSVAFPLACLFMARGFKAEPRWRGLVAFTTIVAVVAIAADGASILALTPLNLTGLQQIVMLAAGLIWMTAAALRLYRLGLPGAA